MHSFTGNLLVASSLVTDPVYAGGVCLLVHQDKENVIGVMLNRPMQPSPEAMLQMFGQQNEVKNRLAPQVPALANSLHFGGPLSGPVVAIHQLSQCAEAETGNGIYVAAQKHHLEQLVRDHPSPYRLIVGHLGWEKDQLEAEIEAGIWHSIPATADSVFSSSGDMWQRLIQRATSNSMARWMNIPDVIGAGELN
jgi:putative transcriptional regulator